MENNELSHKYFNAEKEISEFFSKYKSFKIEAIVYNSDKKKYVAFFR